MARYFQHIDQNDEYFQSVTELEMIDNTDPDFIMFYFKDGSKCSKAFIGSVNSDDTVFGTKAFVEITSPGNAWGFNQINIQETVQKKADPDGNLCVGADPYMKGHENEIGKSSYRICKRPNEIPGFTAEADEKYYMENIMNNLSASLEQPALSQPQNNPIYSQDTNIIDEAVSTDIKEDSQSHVFNIDANKLITENWMITFNYLGTPVSMPAAEFFKNSIEGEKIIEKEVIKEVIKEIPAEEHLNIKIDDAQKELISNMINMSNKDLCDLDMSITLDLPPVSVYKIIKDVYPAGMSEAFVNIIADRMQMIELKTAVAAGLLEYYNESENIAVKKEDK